MVTLSDEEYEELIPKDEAKEHISFEDALNIVESTDDWLSHIAIESLHQVDISKLITFDNAHLVAMELAMSEPMIARAFYEELAYWVNNTKI